MQIGFGEPVLNRYERVCFDKPFKNIQGLSPAAFLVPGHPLLEATIDLVRERNNDVLKRGAIFIDDNDYDTELRLLFCIEDSIQDGVILQGGNKRVISKHIHFVEIRENTVESGSAFNAGYAPYLDYRPLSEEELKLVRPFIDSQKWLKTNVEDISVGYAISQIIPSHVTEVRQRKIKLIEKTIKAVKDRLTSEIQYWDFRAADLKQKEEAGQVNARLNSQMASRRAEELEARMHKRLSDLDSEKLISAMPPVVIGGALVIPCGLLYKLQGKTPDTFNVDPQSRRETELAAMKAVMDIEKSLGNFPRDVSTEKCGYDIESRIPEEKRGIDSPLRFIEVKGRQKGADTVTVTKNEILRAFNKPDEYILAIVEVNGAQNKTVYLKKPFKIHPDFAATSVTYNIGELISSAEILLERG
jgi:hypothetical protein